VRIKRLDLMELFYLFCVKKPKLTENAYATIFPNTPSYLSSEPPRKRKTPVDRRQEMSQRDEQQFDWMASDRIETFDEMSDKMDNFLKRYLSQGLCLYWMN
jgi:hypothetical protein